MSIRTDFRLLHVEPPGVWIAYSFPQDDSCKSIIKPDSKDWFEWLAAIPSSFTFLSIAATRRPYHFTARKEQRGQRTYWYAYVKQEGKVRKVYLGKTEHLTGVLLVEKAMLLTEREN